MELAVSWFFQTSLSCWKKPSISLLIHPIFKISFDTYSPIITFVVYLSKLMPLVILELQRFLPTDSTETVWRKRNFHTQLEFLFLTVSRLHDVNNLIGKHVTLKPLFFSEILVIFKTVGFFDSCCVWHHRYLALHVTVSYTPLLWVVQLEKHRCRHLFMTLFMSQRWHYFLIAVLPETY